MWCSSHGETFSLSHWSLITRTPVIEQIQRKTAYESKLVHPRLDNSRVQQDAHCCGWSLRHPQECRRVHPGAEVVKTDKECCVEWWIAFSRPLHFLSTHSMKEEQRQEPPEVSGTDQRTDLPVLRQERRHYTEITHSCQTHAGSTSISQDSELDSQEEGCLSNF